MAERHFIWEATGKYAGTVHAWEASGLQEDRFNPSTMEPVLCGWLQSLEIAPAHRQGLEEFLSILLARPDDSGDLVAVEALEEDPGPAPTILDRALETIEFFPFLSPKQQARKDLLLDVFDLLAFGDPEDEQRNATLAIHLQLLRDYPA
jgi:hypothetical protein